MTTNGGITPWLQDADCTLYHGDVLAVLPELPAESVDCVVTSPPYWGLRDYGQEGQLGLEPTPEQYVKRMVEVFREVRRVLAPHGTVWLNLGDTYNGTNFRPNAPSSQIVRPGTSRHRFAGGEMYNEMRGREGMRSVDGLKPKDLVGIPWRVAFALQQPYYAGKIRDERDRIWLAATVEAEGCLFIHKRKAGQSNGQGYERKNDSYGAGLEVASTDRAVVEKCMEITGLGSICEQSPEQAHRRKQTIYRWSLRSNVCRDVIRELYPHFVAKHHEARLLIGCPSSGEKAARAHESLKAIHQGGAPTIDFDPPETLFEPGWYVRSDIVWSKSNPMPESVTDRPTKAHEYVFLLSKQPRYFFDQEAVRESHTSTRWGGPTITQPPDTKYAEATANGFAGAAEALSRPGREWNAYPNGGRNIRSVWEIATQPYPEAHFATFPEELARRCIAAGCPEQGTVLDPFVGSGTVCHVARKLGRHSIGIDLNESYLELAARRLQQQSLFAEAL